MVSFNPSPISSIMPPMPVPGLDSQSAMSATESFSFFDLSFLDDLLPKPPAPQPVAPQPVPDNNTFMANMLAMLVLILTLLKDENDAPVTDNTGTDLSPLKTRFMTQDGTHLTGLNKTVWDNSLTWLRSHDTVVQNGVLTQNEITDVDSQGFNTLDLNNNAQLDRYEVAGLLWMRSSSLSDAEVSSILSEGSSEAQDLLIDFASRLRVATYASY